MEQYELIIAYIGFWLCIVAILIAMLVTFFDEHDNYSHF